MDYKLSNQAVGAIMMALQRSLMEQTDIVPILQEFQVQIDDSDELVVMNPPTIEISSEPNPEWEECWDSAETEDDGC